MSEVATDKSILETAAPSDGEAAANRAVRRAVTVAAVVIAAHLPLFLVHLRNLWVMRPHYQFFPLLMAGIGWLLWKHWPRWSVAQPPRWWTTGLLACGLATLTVSGVLFSPWLAAAALVLSVGGLIGRYAAPGQWRDWLPVWLVMWLIVPPPFRLDFRLISWLQASTSQMSSMLLDIVGVQHLMEGNVLVLPGHRMLVDEACSGVNSVLVLLVLTALYVVASRRPLIWAVPLLASSIVWAWGANVVRVTTVALAQAWFQLDLSGGWRHELLGYVTILLALIWLGSTNRCLAFFLQPIDLRRADRSSFAFRPSSLTDAWNWCVGAGWAGGKQKKRRSTQPPPPPAPVELPAQPEKGFEAPDYLWLTGFAVLAVLQMAAFAVPAVTRDFHAVRFEQADLPAELAGWALVRHEAVERETSSKEGHYSSGWQYRRGGLECRVSVDYPFEGWHELTNCYTGNGWVRLSRQPVNEESQGGAAGAYVEAEFSKPTGELGWLLFGLFKHTGEFLASEDADRAAWPTIREKLARSPLGSWLLGIRYGGVADTSYQVQVFASRSVGLTAAERAEVRKLFLAARAGALNAYLDKATKGEGKP